MKRRITIEIDDARFPKAMNHSAALLRMEAEVNLALLIGPMEMDGQRTNAAAILPNYGVTLISDEQID